MIHVKVNEGLKKFLQGEGMFAEKRISCPVCNTLIKFHSYCEPMCPGCYELVPPVNELFEGGQTQRVAYHLDKLL